MGDVVAVEVTLQNGERRFFRSPYGPGVILVRRPSSQRVEEYRRARVDVAPTATPDDHPQPGFHHDTFTRAIGLGPEAFERARHGLRQWAAHRGSGVEVFPADASVTPGSTVAVLTRQLGVWVLAACRVHSVIDEPTRFGFVYATLPDHPECGYESFIVTDTGDQILFEIEAVSRPGIAIVRLGAPVTKIVQRRASDAYLTALQNWVEADATS